MSIAEQILKGIYILVFKKNIPEFTRKNVRDILNIDSHKWHYSYNPIFQAMRTDPGRAPIIRNEYIGLLMRSERGIYKLTKKGRELLITKKFE